MKKMGGVKYIIKFREILVIFYCRTISYK